MNTNYQIVLTSQAFPVKIGLTQQVQSGIPYTKIIQFNLVVVEF